jgi:hypothetical protein
MIHSEDTDGFNSIHALHRYFSEGPSPGFHAMIGHRLRSTLPARGPLQRYLFELDDSGYLRGLHEAHDVPYGDRGELSGPSGTLSGNELANLDCFGFGEGFFLLLDWAMATLAHQDAKSGNGAPAAEARASLERRHPAVHEEPVALAGSPMWKGSMARVVDLLVKEKKIRVDVLSGTVQPRYSLRSKRGDHALL